MFLSVAVLFVLLTASFVVYTNSRNMKQVAGLILESSEAKPQTGHSEAARPDEMISRRWKVLPGNYPAFSSEEVGGGNRSEKL